MTYVSLEPVGFKRRRGLRQRRVRRARLVAVIALPPPDASGSEASHYMSSVRKELDALKWIDGWYRLADGSRGGWFSSPTLAIQELCHEVVAMVRESLCPLPA